MKRFSRKRLALLMSVFGRTVFYTAVLLVLLYLYYYNHFGDATFIYNEF